MASSFFEVKQRSARSRARLGTITTDHGVVHTPAFVSVATKGTLKSIFPSLIKEIGTQISFVNTYHLVTHPGQDIIAKAGGIHTFAQLQYPLMSDSGGFQVFSLGKKTNNKTITHNNNIKHKTGEKTRNIKHETNTSGEEKDVKGVRHLQADVRGEEKSLLIKISEDGVVFRSVYDGQTITFTPEQSIDYQKKIGADILMSFDECTYYPATHEYAQKSMDRTHEWVQRCINRKKNTDVKSNTHHQYLYGVIQGAHFEDLRKKSAEFVTKQEVDGVAIGGVSVGETKKEMRDQVRWVADYLPADKPVHLLGVGEIDDIFDLVTYGIDTFDCVEPTRLARMGILYQWEPIKQAINAIKQSGTVERFSNVLKNYKIDINKMIYKDDLSSIDSAVHNYVTDHFTKSYVHHLFKQKELLGYELATYHNLWIMEEVMREIRRMVKENIL